MDPAATMSAGRLIFAIWLDFILAIAIASALSAAGAFVWLAITPSPPAAFWNPFARHVSYQLTVPADSPEAVALLRKVKRWFDESGRPGEAELRTDADGSWIALVRPASAGRELEAEVLRTSEIISYRRIRMGSGPDWMFRLYRDPDGVQTIGLLLPWLFVSNALALLAISLWRGRRVSRPGGAPPRPLSSRVLWGIAGGVVMLAILEVSGRLLAALGWEQIEQPILDAVRALDGIPFALVSAAIVGLAPVGEELFFRRHAFGRLAAIGRPGVGYAVSALLFAVIHFHPILIPSYVLAGLCLAWLYSRTGWIGTPILAHAVNNTVGLVLLLSA